MKNKKYLLPILIVSSLLALYILNANAKANINELKNDDTKQEIALEIGENTPLEAILTLPKNNEKPPVVLMIQGSGSSDKDSTIYENKPFKDISSDLAKKGIATLRYDKRYYTYPGQANKLGNDITIQDEVLNDVEYALELLSKDTRINTDEIYVLGHSMGAGLTPYLAYKYDNIKGIIAMSGSLRALYEISYDQNKEVEKEILNGDYDKETKDKITEQMKTVESDIITLREDDLSKIDKTKTLMGLPVRYQQSMKETAGINYIDKIDTKILVLQGKEDFQVNVENDYNLWLEKLENNKNAEFRLYDNLNHLMMKSSGKKDLSEYEIKSNVDKSVTDDIANFILNK